MTSKEYAKQGGVRCPVCRSANIEGDRVEIDDSGAWQAVDCADCGAAWIDTYKLTGYTNLTEG